MLKDICQDVLIDPYVVNENPHAQNRGNSALAQ
jgi:hypothetical protein